MALTRKQLEITIRALSIVIEQFETLKRESTYSSHLEMMLHDAREAKRSLTEETSKHDNLLDEICELTKRYNPRVALPALLGAIDDAIWRCADPWQAALAVIAEISDDMRCAGGVRAAESWQETAWASQEDEEAGQ